MTWTLPAPPPSFDDYDALARYNAERARGIVHDPQWVARMAQIQASFDALMIARGIAAVEAGDRKKRWWQR